MITLITGVPGSGKTSKAVSDLALIKDRPIFVMGITDLQIAHEKVPPVAEWTRLEASPEDPNHHRPVFNFPPNSIVVIDEAQNVYRPMAVGSKVPDHVSALETHRHTGIDIWLITQHPSLIHANVRRLVGKHYHVHVHPFGRKLLEWAGAHDPSDKADRANAVTTSYKPPKKAFGLYKSAELHTKPKSAIPKIALIVPVLAIAAVFLSFQIYQRISSKNAPQQELAAAVVPSSVKSMPPGQTSAAITSESFIPSDPLRPESAPIYESVAQVKDFPQIQGCVRSATTCKCLTQQGTDARIPASACFAWVKDLPFNPYKVPPEQLAGESSVPISASPVAQPS